MPRPNKPYSQRNVKSYQRDREYLLRLRSAIFLDPSLESGDVKRATKLIDDLMLVLRDLNKAAA